MKKLLSLAFVLMLAAGVAMAAEKKDPKAPAKKPAAKVASSQPVGESKASWGFQLALDLTLRGTDNTQGGFPMTFLGAGFGYELSGTYNFNQNFSIGLLTGLHAVDVDDPSLYSLDGGSWSYAPTEVFARYAFSGDVRPFLSFGIGVANHQFTLTPSGSDISVGIFSESNLIFSPGIGVEFEMGGADLFTQLRLDILAQSDDFNTIFEGSVFIPFQVGLNFNSL